jgi:hypothetical protein
LDELALAALDGAARRAPANDGQGSPAALLVDTVKRLI